MACASARGLIAMENHVGALQEYAQSTGGVVKYEEITCGGPDHNKT